MKNAIRLFQEITDELFEDEKLHPVSRHIPSSDLYKTLDLSLDKTGMPDSDFQQILKQLVLASPRTATNGFFNQLFGGRNEKAILGELLSVILNNSMYTYKAAGPQIGVEKTIIREVCNLIGWDHNSDGTLAPGGIDDQFHVDGNGARCFFE